MQNSDESAALELLIAVDGSPHAEAALRWVAGLKAFGINARCVLLNVQKPIMTGEVGLIAPAAIALEAREHSAAEILARAVHALESMAVRYETHERMGTPESVIVETAEQHDCAAIVVGRRGLGVLRAALLGSVSSAIVRRAALPVVVVDVDVAVPAGDELNILLATDGSEASGRAATFAALLAGQARRACVRILHVQPGMTVAEAVLGPRDQLLERWSGSDEKRATSPTRAILEQAKCRYDVHSVLAADTGEAIVRAANDLGCALIAMGTRGLGPIAGALLGSVAQHVVAHARQPVALTR